MTRRNVNILTFAIAALLIASASVARAGEGNGDPFPFRAPGVTNVVSPQTYAVDTGSAAYPDFTGRSSWTVAAGGADALSANGSEGAVQTAKSLPQGFAEGTVAYAQAQSVRRYLARQETGQARMAERARILRGGPRG